MVKKCEAPIVSIPNNICKDKELKAKTKSPVPTENQLNEET